MKLYSITMDRRLNLRIETGCSVDFLKAKKGIKTPIIKIGALPVLPELVERVGFKGFYSGMQLEDKSCVGFSIVDNVVYKNHKPIGEFVKISKGEGTHNCLVEYVDYKKTTEEYRVKDIGVKILTSDFGYSQLIPSNTPGCIIVISIKHNEYLSNPSLLYNFSGEIFYKGKKPHKIKEYILILKKPETFIIVNDYLFNFKWDGERLYELV